MKWYNLFLLGSLLLLVCVLSGCSNEDYIPITNNIYNSTINNITNNITTIINETNNITINITNNFTTSTPINVGVINDTFNVSTIEEEGYFNNPFFAYGCSHNYLLQTDSFGTTWVRRSGIAITNNDAISPIGTLIAENVRGNVSTTLTYQQLADTNLRNMTFSIWMRSYNNNGDNIVGLRLITNNISDATTFETNFTLTNDWKRYNITRDIKYVHQFLNVSIINGVNNISLWGAQLENGTNARMYGAPRTTSANPVESCYSYFRGNSVNQGRGTFAGVAVGGALSGATTIANSGTQTTTYASVLNTLNSYGHIFTSSASTTAIRFQGAPLVSFRSTIWNGTLSTNQEFNWGTIGNNLTNETTLVLFNKNNLGVNKSIVNITSSIYSNVYPITILWDNRTIHKFYASDNSSQFMCLNVSQDGSVTAYKC